MPASLASRPAADRDVWLRRIVRVPIAGQPTDCRVRAVRFADYGRVFLCCDPIHAREVPAWVPADRVLHWTDAPGRSAR